MARPQDPLFRAAARLLGRPADAADEALLDRVARGRDPLAFAELVARHGPAVWTVCRRTTRTAADAEDAFQATFLVLARNAGRVRKSPSVGSWLHGVAARVGRKARLRGDRRPDPARLHHPAPAADPADALTWAELRAVLDEELAALPDPLRAPLLLCYYRGLTQDEAAAELGWKVRTLKARVARGRDRLRRRLTRRGVELPAALSAPLLATEATAVPPRLAAVACHLIDRTTRPATSAAVLDLARTEAPAMTLARVTLLAATAAGLVAVAGPLGGGPAVLPADPPAVAAAPEPPPPGAAVRLGSTQLRTVGWHQKVFFTADGNTLISTREGEAVDLWDPVAGRKRGEIAVPKSRFDDADYHPASGRLAIVGNQWADKDGALAEPVAVIVDVPGRKIVRTFRIADDQYTDKLWGRFTSDGKRLVVANRRGGLRVYDAGTGDELLRQSARGIDAFALSPDGKTVAFGYSDLFLWDWESGEEPRKFTAVSGVRIETIGFGPDGKSLYLAEGDGRVGVWDIKAGRKVEVLNVGSSPHYLVLSPDGKTLATSFYGSVKDETAGLGVALWDVATGKPAGRLMTGRSTAGFASWSADGTRLAATTNYSLWAWDVKTGKSLSPATPGHEGDIRDLAWSPDGGRLFTASTDGTVRSWDAGTGRMGLTLQHKYWVCGVAVLPDGTLVAGSGLRDDLRIWDATTGEVRFRLLGNGQMGGKRLVRFTADGKRLVAWGDDEFVRVWDVRTGKLLSEHTTRPAADKADEGDVFADKRHLIETSFYPAEISRDGATLLLGSHTGLRLIDPATGAERPGPVLDPDRRVSAFTLSPDGKRLGVSLGAKHKEVKQPDGSTRSVSEDNHPVGVYDLATGKPVWRAEVPYSGWGAGVAFSPDGRRFAEFSRAKERGDYLRVWDAATGEYQGRVSAPGGWGHLAFDPAGKRIAIAFWDTTAGVYDLGTSLKKE